MKLGLTGGRGFLAYNLFQFLASVEAPPDIHAFGGDILDQDALGGFVTKVDLLIHLAAYTDTVRADEEKERCFAVNVDGTANVLEACHRAGTKLIHVSTGEIHGFSGAYAESKRMGDQKCRNAYEERGQDVVIARPYSLFGYRQNPDKLIPRFIRLASFGEPLLIEGDGTTVKDYVFALDVAEALWSLRAVPAGAVAEIATGQGHSIGEIADIVIEAVDAPYPSTKVFSNETRDREPAAFVGSYEELRELTGWQPKHTLQEGILKVVHWYRHPAGIQTPPITGRG